MSELTPTGLVIDRLSDIKAQIQEDLRKSFGDGVDLDERSPLGVLVGIMSERFALLNELVEAVHDASYPSLAYGIYLDYICAYNGVVRESATASVVDLDFTRSSGSTGDVLIPQGTQVYAQGSSYFWETETDISIPDGSDTVTVRAKANELGPIGALAGTLTNMVLTPTNIDSVVNPLDAILGQDKETDAALRLRRAAQIANSGTPTESGIKSAINLLPSVRSVSLSINDTGFEVNGQPSHSIETFIATNTGYNYRQDSSLLFSKALEVGDSIHIEINGVEIGASPIAFNTDNNTTLDDIATAIQAEAEVSTASRSGSDLILVDGASAVETDVYVYVVGADPATVTRTYIGSDLDEVAQALWESKAAGIQTFGDLVGTATDNEGNTRLMYFSTISAIEVEVQFTLGVDGDYDLPTTEAAIRQDVSTYALNVLTPSEDVLSYKLSQIASEVGAAGIRTLSCGVRISGVGSFVDIVDVDESEIALIDSSDISFVYV